MSSALSPRPDQIAELTRGLDLPLNAIDHLHLEIIVEGVARAFAAVRAAAPGVIATGNEAEITALLQARLNAMIEDDPLWGQLVASVVRGAESLSFDGTHLEKRPDLSIHLTARSQRVPLIAEAKIMDAGKSEALYCSQGVKRFLVGEYGWGGREAIMIAYVRDKASTIGTRLVPYLALPAQAATYAVEAGPSALAPSPCDAAHSRHGRAFLYAHTPPPANDPGAISLWHLWLDATP
jgi:hypothetical protein